MKRVPKTIDICWEYCVELWTDIKAVMLLANNPPEETQGIFDIKERWMSLNGLEEKILNDCFFCFWAEKRSGVIDPNIPGGCPDCPGTKVDPSFACQLDGKKWNDNPVEFADYIIKLNQKRLRRKKR